MLNSKLPFASRLHLVEEFNKKSYYILIASDKTKILWSGKEDGASRAKKKFKTDKKGNNDYGASRGIHFLRLLSL
jgi:superfamily II DNA/RNA helicase